MQWKQCKHILPFLPPSLPAFLLFLPVRQHPHSFGKAWQKRRKKIKHEKREAAKIQKQPYPTTHPSLPPSLPPLPTSKATSPFFWKAWPRRGRKENTRRGKKETTGWGSRRGRPSIALREGRSRRRGWSLGYIERWREEGRREYWVRAREPSCSKIK